MTTLTPTPFPVSGMPAQPQRRLWLITFVDLVMLLLAFFVLLFSMSSVDRPGFAAVAQSYADVFHGGGGAGGEAAVGPVHLPLVARAPGDDLAYLETLLRTTFAQDPALSVIQFRLTSQYLILMVPAHMTAAAGVEVLDDQTQGRFFDLGGVLNNLSNRIAIVAPATAGDNAAAWAAAAARARGVQAALQATGYQRHLATLVQGSAEENASDGELPPIQIIIFPETTSQLSLKARP